MLRLALPLGVLLAFAGCGGCGNNQPCSVCPQVAGSWLMALDDSRGTVDPSCASLGIQDPSGPWVITQSAAILHGTYAGFDLTGTLYDSYDLSMTGLDADAGQPASISIHGTFIPNGPNDGGTIKGDFTAQYSGTVQGQSVTCNQSLPFSATQ